MSLKPIAFLGDSLNCLRDFPEDVRQDAGFQLDTVQRGRQPDDFKPIPSIGKGVEELRIWDETGPIGLFIWRGYPTRFMSFMPSRKKRKRPPSGISSWRLSAITT